MSGILMVDDLVREPSYDIMPGLSRLVTLVLQAEMWRMPWSHTLSKLAALVGGGFRGDAKTCMLLEQVEKEVSSFAPVLSTLRSGLFWGLPHRQVIGPASLSGVFSWVVDVLDKGAAACPEDFEKDDDASVFLDSDSDSDSEADTPSTSVITFRDKTFTLSSILGEGGFGRVMYAVDEHGAEFAVKVIHKAQLYWEGDAKRNVATARNENDILRRLTTQTETPFITKLFYAFEDETNYYLAMDYYPTSLGHLLKHGYTFKLDTIRFYAAELLLAVETLHANRVLHRDLKPDNILISHSGHLAIADFSCSKRFSSSRSLSKCFAWDVVGTRGYHPPEVFSASRRMDSRADVWGFGVVLLEMFAGGGEPFFASMREDDPDSEFAITVGDIGIGAVVGDEDARDLLQKILVRDPKQRITLSAAKQHPFFAAIDWSSLERCEFSAPDAPNVEQFARGARNGSLSFSSWHAAHYSYEDCENKAELGGEFGIEGFEFEWDGVGGVGVGANSPGHSRSSSMDSNCGFAVGKDQETRNVAVNWPVP